jgi:hypothetical protein
MMQKDEYENMQHERTSVALVLVIALGLIGLVLVIGKVSTILGRNE